MTRTFAVAALAAAALALQGAFLHAAIAAPLSSAVAALDEHTRPTFEETIVVTAPQGPKAAKAKKA